MNDEEQKLSAFVEFRKLTEKLSHEFIKKVVEETKKIIETKQYVPKQVNAIRDNTLYQIGTNLIGVSLAGFGNEAKKNLLFASMELALETAKKLEDLQESIDKEKGENEEKNNDV